MACRWQPGMKITALLDALNSAPAEPFALAWVSNSPRFLLVFTVIYAVVVIVAVTDQKNTRPGAEHGSAAWGDVFRLNKFYMDKRGPNLLLTQHFHIGIDGYKHMLCKEGYADVLFELGNRMSPLQSVEYCDNRLARFVASKGKCEITGKLLSVNEVHCHHFLPRHLGGTDQYSNLRIVHVDVHRLIHATTPESIQFYLRKTGCYKKPCLDKINRWRASANLPAITL